MAYYVPLGPRGLILRLGTTVLGVFGGLIYWHASRRRPDLVPVPVLRPVAVDPDR